MQKNHGYLCCLDGSHLSMCMVTRGHFITTKSFPRGQRKGQGQRHGRQLSLSPCFPLAPPMLHGLAP